MITELACRTSTWRPKRLQLIGALGFIFLVASTPLYGWTLSCEELCDAATQLQSYGTGAEDSACISACEAGGSRCLNAQSQDLWNLYFTCVDSGNPIESCREAYGDAKECSVCQHGDIGLWNEKDVLFVNRATCNTNPLHQASGKYDDPLCKFQHGIDGALNRQKNGFDTKVIVCEGVYREGYRGHEGIDATNSGSGKVIVEAAVRDHAVISGSEDWSNVWKAQAFTAQETIYNELERSNQLNHSEWAKYQVGIATNWINDPPTFALPAPTKVFEITPNLPPPNTNAELTDPMILSQQIPLLTNRLATFSIYIRPNGATRFKLDLRISNTQTTTTGAFYSFDLPPNAPCAVAESSGAAGVGIEEAGNGWYRVHLTQRVDTDPNTLSPPNGVLQARFHLVGPLLQGQGAEIFAPQLDHRPLDQFETTPRTYFESFGSNQIQIATPKNLFTNDTSQREWTHDWGLVRRSKLWKNLPPLMRRSEMIFVDGQPLRQELSFVDMEPGSFLIDDGISYGGFNYKEDENWIPGLCSSNTPCPIWIYPPEGVTLNKALVEVAVEPKLLWLNGLHDWEIRGLNFQHSTGAYDADEQEDCPANPDDCIYPLNTSAVALVNALDLTLRENRFDWNSSFGLGVGGRGDSQDSNITLIRNTANDNGIGGEGIGAARNFRVIDEEFSRNNWRGRRVGILGHNATGAKYGGLAKGSIQNITANHNYGSGLWFDFNNQAMHVSNSTFSFNEGAGLYFEAIDAWPVPAIDPTTFVRYNLLEGNGIGIQGISSSDIRLSNNQLINNDVGVRLIGTPRNDPDATRKLRNWYITENTFDAVCPQNMWLDYGDNRGISDYTDWTPFTQSLVSNENRFSNPSGIKTLGFSVKTIPSDFTTWTTCTQASPTLWCIQTHDVNSSFIP